MNGNYQIGDVVFGNWVILSEIGKGSFGRVYVVGHKDDRSITAALKVITVPQDQAEVRMAADEGLYGDELSQHFYGMVQEIEKEFKLQFKVKGSGHVVAYEDHQVICHEDQFGRDILGWDILIRMELLTPLLTWAYEHPMTRADIMRLGIHLCKALEACQAHGILHRDIKPENIFVSGTGDYKLGDFGVARTMEKTISNMSKKGTYNYMAPEVYKGLDCNFKADIYSVGIVMYRLLNRNRFPFLPPAPQTVSMRDREQALARRMKGERLPLPVNAQDRLGEIVIKAADYDPAQRYNGAAEMRRELEEALRFERDDRTIYPDAEELKRRQGAGMPMGANDPSVTPRMSDRTVYTNQGVSDFGKVSEDSTLGTSGGTVSGFREDPHERTSAGTYAGFQRTEAGRGETVEEPEDPTESTVSAWARKTASKTNVTAQDRMQDASDEMYIAMKRASSGAMGDALKSVKNASADALAAAKLAKENRPARNEKEAQEAYEKARKELDAKTAERQTLEKMAIPNPQLKAEMMREAAKAEMEASAKAEAARKVWEEFRQKRLAEEEAKRQEELKRKEEENRRLQKKVAKQEAKAATKSGKKVKRGFSGKTVLGIVVFLGLAIAIGLIGFSMARKAVVIAEKYWDVLYEALDVEGDLNYRTSSLEEIGQVLDAVGFQFQDEQYDLVDEPYIDTSNGRSLRAQFDMSASAEVLVSEGDWGSRTVIFRGEMSDFYQAQSAGDIPVILPGQLVLGSTTAKDLGIDEDMIRWAQRGNETKVGAWEVYTYGGTDQLGNGECVLSMTNDEANKRLDLYFYISPDENEYVLHEIGIEFPEDPSVVWGSVLEDLHQKLYQSLDLTEVSGINYQTDSLESIVEKLKENGATFSMPEGSESEIYEVSNGDVPVPNKEFYAEFYDDSAGYNKFNAGVTMRDEYYDGMITRLVSINALNWEDYADYSQLLPVSGLVPGKTTMEELGITKEMLDAVKEADGGNGSSGYGFYYGDLRVYQCEYKNDDPDSWYIHITKTDPNAQYEVGTDYVDITMSFDSVDDQWILYYWRYEFAMDRDPAEEAAAE